MAGRARRLVIAVEHEEFVMIERGWFPPICVVTLAAARAEIAMNPILRSGVAGSAPAPRVFTQQRVRERMAAAQRELSSLVIAMAGHAVLSGQLLVERNLGSGMLNWRAFGCTKPDIPHRVADDASLCGGPPKGGVACETVL